MRCLGIARMSILVDEMQLAVGGRLMRPHLKFPDVDTGLCFSKHISLVSMQGLTFKVLLNLAAP